MITKLKPNQVFVFGSNLEGHHGAGAARQAFEQFGAEWGVGVGLSGQSYAIPTMHGFHTMKAYVNQFLEFAQSKPELEFLVTSIGTGIAGFKPEEVAPLFENAPSNVVLPEEFTDLDDLPEDEENHLDYKEQEREDLEEARSIADE